jgi:hypothetical protein
MADRTPKKWCPSCEEFTKCKSDIDPSFKEDQAYRTKPVGKRAGDAMGLWRTQVCPKCQLSWDSIEVPKQFLDSLIEFRDGIEAQNAKLDEQAEHGWHAKKPRPSE